MNDSKLSWQIPLQFIRDGVPLVAVPAFVNDRGPFVCILDTGNATAPFILSRGLAEKLKIEARPSAEFGMPSVVGTQPTELLAATAGSVALGPFRQNNLRIGVSKAMDQLSRSYR